MDLLSYLGSILLSVIVFQFFQYWRRAKKARRQNLQPITQQTIEQQISILNEQINKIENNTTTTNNQKQYDKHQYQQQFQKKLKDLGEAKSIPHIKQNIETSNPELLFYVLKESLLRDQNRELLTTSEQYSFGIDSILGAYGQDQSCLKVGNTNLDYDSIVKDTKLLQQHLLEFKQKLSSSLNISIDQIEVLEVSKGSFEINFNIKDKNIDEIQQLIKSSPAAKKFLNEYCKMEYVMFFIQASDNAKGVILKFDDFNTKFDKNWDNFQEKEQRGPPYHRYDYYFPIGCYGFGLNVKKYEGSQNWILMDGNLNEWRIMYHGTKQEFVSSIVKDGLAPGKRNMYADDDDCMYGSGKVGNGIYFSDKYTVCVYDGNEYAPFTQVGNKQFAVIFMSRVNPKKIRQSEDMKKKNYFVVNNSSDVRPYRILLHEKK